LISEAFTLNLIVDILSDYYERRWRRKTRNSPEMGPIVIVLFIIFWLRPEEGYMQVLHEFYPYS